MAAGPVHKGICIQCGGDVETTRIEGRQGYWWRCRSCGWTFEATRYDAYLAARAEFAEAWARLVDRVIRPLVKPSLRRGVRPGRRAN